MMDDQSFELLLSKLDSLEAGQSRIETQINKRLDLHYELFEKHTAEDKKLAEHITAVDREVTFAKGVAYVLSGGTALGAWFTGWGK